MNTKCVGLEAKALLIKWLSKNIQPEVIMDLVETLPICSMKQEPRERRTERTERSVKFGTVTPAKLPKVEWPEAYYIDEKGVQSGPWNLSDLYSAKTGEDSPGMVCSLIYSDGETVRKCHPASLVESLVMHGFLIKTNGDLFPGIDTSKSASQRAWETAEWKRKIQKKTLYVYHPDSVKEK